ncbi:repair protein PSO2 SNM1, partial [Linderina pennispora]
MSAKAKKRLSNPQPDPSDTKTKKARGAETAACPICNKWFANASMLQAHANMCLDFVELEEKKAQRMGKTQSPGKIKSPGKTLSPGKMKSPVQQGSPARPKQPEAKASVSRSLNARLRMAMDRKPRPNEPPPKPKLEEQPPEPEEPPSDSIDALLSEIEQTELAPETSTETRYTYLAQEDGIWPTSRTSKPPPSYKRMPHTPFTVDAFKYGRIADCTGYFLTHFHSDHYGGLTRSFAGHVYCSRITANLVRHRLGVGESHVHALPMHRRCLVHGVYVTLLDAMHCPGAALILFEVPGETVKRIVHTGDFRAAPLHLRQIARVFATDLGRPVTPEMLGGEEAGRPSVDYVYLDTTYLEPRYMFPPQNAVVAAVGELCCRIHSTPGCLRDLRRPALRITQWFRPQQQQQPPRTLFAVGTYTIGKEKLLVEIARRLNSQIYAAQDKRILLKCLGSPGLERMLADRPGEALVHAVSMQSVNMKGMAEYLEKNPGFDRIVAFRPTGWTHAGPT